MNGHTILHIIAVFVSMNFLGLAGGVVILTITRDLPKIVAALKGE